MNPIPHQFPAFAHLHPRQDMLRLPDDEWSDWPRSDHRPAWLAYVTTPDRAYTHAKASVKLRRMMEQMADPGAGELLQASARRKAERDRRAGR